MENETTLPLSKSESNDELPDLLNGDDPRTPESNSRESSVEIRQNSCRHRSKHKKFKGYPEWKQTKLESVEKALRSDPVDITSLCQLAISRGGLIADDIRRKVWPHLLSVNVYATSPRPVLEEITNYRDYNQVVLDVNRCVRRFPPGIEEQRRLALQDELIFLIVRILIKYPELHYYQGFHDICITFLLCVGEELAFALVECLSLSHLSDFMDTTMEKTTQMLNYLYPILGRVNGALRDHMENAGVGTIFCLSWLITWFGHVLNDYRHIVRLYDFFLACHPLMPIYLAAAIVLHRENDILAADCDMATLHSLLSKVPEDLPFEDLIVKTGDLFLQYPPADLVSEVEDLNRRGFMGLREPEHYPASNAKHSRNQRTSKTDHRKNPVHDKKRFSNSLSRRTFSYLTPHWLQQRRGLRNVLLCSLTVTVATALYSYMTQNESLAFFYTWYNLHHK